LGEAFFLHWPPSPFITAMSSYKLYYFNARGVAEPIRLMLAYANVNFEDVRFARGPEWLKIKPDMPWNVVPVLEVDGERISQSRAILRFLASRFGMIPENDFEEAKCHEYTEYMVDLRTEGKKFHRESDPNLKAQLKESFLADKFPSYMEKLNKILKATNTGFLIGSKLTYADIFVAYTMEQISSWIHSPTLLDSYSEVKAHLWMVLSQPGIKEWIASRPKTPS